MHSGASVAEVDQNLANQLGSKLKVGLIRAAARRRRAEHANTLPSDTETLSPTGAAAVQFTSESPGLSEPQKDRVAEVIAVLDNMNERERNLVKALVSEPLLIGRRCRRDCRKALSRMMW
jgi:hypothetical protein